MKHHYYLLIVLCFALGRQHVQSFGSGYPRPTTSSTPSAIVDLIESETQAKVVIVGVFHGSNSSSEDVKRAMRVSKVDILVLELCNSRFLELQRQREQNTQQRHKEMERTISLNGKNRSRQFTDTITQSKCRRGFATVFASSILLGFVGLQSALSGFTPGLEFLTALSESDEADVILADQAVEETIAKVGNIWDTVSREFIWEHFPDGTRQRRSFLGMCKQCQLHLSALHRAIFGKPSDVPQIRLLNVLFRSQAALNDLIRLTFPFVLLLLILLIAGTSSQVLSMTTLGVANANNVLSYPNEQEIAPLLGHLIASSVILSIGVLATIPVIQVFLSERDDILAEGILKACRRAGTNGKVVVVLGLLHVNGVASKLAKAKEKFQ